MRTSWGVPVTVLMLGVMLPATGCRVICPATGWASIITVNVEGAAAAVDEVQLCSDHGCSHRLPDYGPAVPTKSVQPGAKVSDTPAPFIPATPPVAFLATRTGIDTWSFSISQPGLPEYVTVRALAPDRSLLADQQNHLTWTRVGRSEQCGGPVTTPPITLRVDSK